MKIKLPRVGKPLDSFNYSVAIANGTDNNSFISLTIIYSQISRYKRSYLTARNFIILKDDGNPNLSDLLSTIQSIFMNNKIRTIKIVIDNTRSNYIWIHAGNSINIRCSGLEVR